MPSNTVSPSLRRLSPATGSESPLRLIAFPFAGAGAYTFRTWADQLPAHVELLGIQLPGREDRFDTHPLDDLSAVLELLGEELTDVVGPDGDWVVFGHSLGAVLAAEVARTLVRSHGWPAPRHIMVSGCRALHLVHRHRSPVGNLSDAELVEHMRELNGTPEEILADASIREVLLRLVRADYSLFDQYRYADPPPLTAPLTVFAGDADPSTSPDTLEPWSQLTTGSCEFHTLPGDHFFLNQSRALLLRLVNEVLESARPVPG